jgi:redox-sensitive bicupin YhaK (pirin superfamily)
MVDPFLMLDEFSSDNPNDYIAGFPDHPHRGFETVTYMLDGSMEHRDSVGNRGLLGSGDVQWMTAGRGIIHSEMPRQESGLMRGFQLWVNLPASEKMNEPRYQDIPAAEIPVHRDADGAFVKVIAGEFEGLRGPVVGVHTEPLMLDLKLSPKTRRRISIPAEHAGFVYVFEGSAEFGDDASPVGKEHLGVLGPGDEVVMTSEGGARVLLLAAAPINEPVARYGPFVMNTREELEQAVLDYRSGRLA